MTVRTLLILWRRRDGNVTMLLAGALVMLCATAALGIDTASIFLEKRRLQGIADAAALSAASDPTAARPRADAALRANAHGDAHIVDTATGAFTPDPSIGIDQRFVTGASAANAVRVSLESSTPTFFARIFGGARTTTVAARATAARIDLAAFSIGSRLAAAGGGLPGALLSGLAGTELNLSVNDYNALVGGQIDVLRLMELLRARMGLQVATFGEVLATDITLPQAVEAMAGATADAATAQALRSLARSLPNRTVRLGTLIDLGPLADSVHADPDKPVATDAYSLLRETLSLGAASRQVAADISLGIPGIASTKVWLEIGERPAGTPWLAISAARRTVVRTAQTRLWIDVRLAGAAPLGLGTIRVPVFIELAQAEATLANVNCSAGRTNVTATLDVTPAVGEVAIADLDPALLGTFVRVMDLRPAKIVTAPLASVTAFADIRLGGTRAQSITFTASDIANHNARTVSTNDITAGVAGSLLRRVDFNVDLVGIGLSVGVVTGTVGNALSLAAPALDAVVDQVTALAGVRVGQADVWVNGVRCGTPVLVG